MFMFHLTLRFTEQPFSRLFYDSFERKFMDITVNRNNYTIL